MTRTTIFRPWASAVLVALVALSASGCLSEVDQGDEGFEPREQTEARDAERGVEDDENIADHDVLVEHRVQAPDPSRHALEGDERPGDDSEGPDPNPWYHRLGPEPNPWQDGDDDKGGGEQEDPNPDPWAHNAQDDYEEGE
jgi:hypothetical protein